MQENNAIPNKGMVDINVFLKDPGLVNKINSKINKYNFRPAPDKGLRYKRTPEDSIIEAGNFKAMWFIDEFLHIMAKDSKLPRSIRSCVELYVVTSMQELYYENLKKNQNGNKEKSRGKSTDAK